MNKTLTPRQEKKLENQKRIDRCNAHNEETRRIVATGKCPLCGEGLKRNLSLTGWWQCAQLGAEGFRKDSAKPSCSWQGFTE